MKKFKDINEVEDWLEPMDYETFWREIAAFGLILPSRAQCDADIEEGKANEDMVLTVMKSLVRLELTRLLGLQWRDPLMKSSAVH